jgi:hypothetical protein
MERKRGRLTLEMQLETAVLEVISLENLTNAKGFMAGFDSMFRRAVGKGVVRICLLQYRCL